MTTKTEAQKKRKAFVSLVVKLEKFAEDLNLAMDGFGDGGATKIAYNAIETLTALIREPDKIAF